MNKTHAGFKVSPRILDHLGIAAYNSLQKCLAELSANAHDADACGINVSLPDVIDDNAVIDITDDGTGMSLDEIENDYLFIGRNRRSKGQRTKSGRLAIGSKGIGKFAGFGVASRIQVTAWKEGTQTIAVLDRSSFDDFENISTQKIQLTSTPTNHSDGTQIRLAGLNKDLTLPNVELLRRHLYKSLPKHPNFVIKVNDVECSAEDVKGETTQISRDIDGLGKISGFYTIAESRQAAPGFAIRVRGRIVTEPSLFGLSSEAHGYFTARKIIGEINADFLDPETGASDSESLINTSRDGFLADSPVVQKLNSWIRSFLDQIITGIDAQQQRLRTNEILKQPSINDRLSRMPAHVRGTVKNVVAGVVSKLGNVNDEDTTELIEMLLKFYESNILRELIRAISAADASDTEKLAELVQEWGVRQMTSIVGSVKDQIEIIRKLEELTASDKALEIELHKLIETNLWLVKEGLELWHSDKPLKVVLEKQVQKIYKDNEDLRPDILCKSRDSGNDAVVLEFKRPKEKIRMEHVTQAIQYKALLLSHRPSILFDTYVIGREYSPDVLAARDSFNDLHLLSYEEILQKARMRFEKVLEILGQ